MSGTPAAGERRVERRQGLGVGELKEKLLTQARALRARLGRELGRVKEWIAERFPDPLQQLKDRSRDLFDAVAEKVREALWRGAGPERGDVTPNLLRPSITFKNCFTVPTSSSSRRPRALGLLRR